MRDKPRCAGLFAVAFGLWAAGCTGGGSAAPPPPAPAESAPAEEDAAGSSEEGATNPGSEGEPRTVQPGAPGEPTRTVEATPPTDRGLEGYSDADVHFMQGMIPHHAQALEMTALVARRTSNEAIRNLALRMEISQRDEIELMQRWLRERGEALPEPGSHAAHGEVMSAGGDTAGRDAVRTDPGEIPGMLSEEEMSRLAEAEEAAFDRLFLELMIQHHEGALRMVDELLAAPGGGQAAEIFQFASHVEEDQQMEIDRMRAMLDAWER